MSKVKLFEEIRRERRDGATIRGLADSHGVHRRTVRQAIGDAVPPVRKTSERDAPVLGLWRATIKVFFSTDINPGLAIVSPSDQNQTLTCLNNLDTRQTDGMNYPNSVEKALVSISRLECCGDMGDKWLDRKPFMTTAESAGTSVASEM